MRTSSGSLAKLVYVSGRNDNDDMKDKLTKDLMGKVFVMANDAIRSERDFLDTCYGIVSSDAMVFLLNESSVLDANSLSQLGLAVSFNIPIISVRRFGFAMNMPLPPSYAKTGIVDRTMQVILNGKSFPGQLPCVTTLRDALQKCFKEAVLYHESCANDCLQQIYRKLANLRDRRSYSLPKYHVEADYTLEETVNGVKISPFPLPLRMVTVKSNKLNGKSETTVTGIVKELQNESSKWAPRSVKTKQFSHHASNLQDNDTNSLSLTLPVKSLKKQVRKAVQNPAENGNERKNSDSNNERRGSNDFVYKGLRRVSSLPSIPTNYLVAHEDSKLALHTYRFPLSPSQPLAARSESYDEEDLYIDINISRAGTPVIDGDTEVESANSSMEISEK